ncbi:hypothetical protein [Caminibacter sp.]
MKSKIVVMVLTFIVMVALTPLVFGKLMNSKFDKMLQNIQKQGIEIKEIKDKSSYLQTDRIFEVKIPGSRFDSPEIKCVCAIIESRFKNLPVTTVDFNGTVTRVELKDADNQKLNEIIKNKIKFFVTTPNFRIYQYRVMDNSIKADDVVISFKGIKGVLDYPKKNIIEMSKIKLKSETQPINVEVKNIKNEYDKNLNEYITKTSFDLNGSFGKFKFALNNLNSKSVVIDSAGKVNNVSELHFNNLNIANFVDINKTDLTLKIRGADKKILDELKNATSKEIKQRLLLKLISKGLQIDSNLEISDIKYLTQNLGFFDMKAFINFKPTENIEQRIQNNDFGFVDFDINIKTTPTIAQVLVLLEPKLSFVLQNANKNGAVVIEIKKQNGEIYINGRKIKSD